MRVAHQSLTFKKDSVFYVHIRIVSARGVDPRNAHRISRRSIVFSVELLYVPARHPAESPIAFEGVVPSRYGMNSNAASTRCTVENAIVPVAVTASAQHASDAMPCIDGICIFWC